MNSAKKYNILGPRTHFDAQNHSSGSQKPFIFPNKIQFLHLLQHIKTFLNYIIAIFQNISILPKDDEVEIFQVDS